MFKLKKNHFKFIRAGSATEAQQENPEDPQKPGYLNGLCQRISTKGKSLSKLSTAASFFATHASSNPVIGNAALIMAGATASLVVVDLVLC